MGKVVLVLLGLVILVPLLSLGAAALGIINLPFFKLNKQVDLNYGVINKVYDTDYCLANYEWFKQTEEGIKGMDTKIANAQEAVKTFETSAGSRDKWTFEDKNQDAELTSRVTALKNIKVTMTNEYNARAESLNRVACKELPLFIQP